MKICSLNANDWQQFLDWTEKEGWQFSFHERRLFQNQWRPYFFVLKLQGENLGFVSAIAYKKSGWIGNLIINPAKRGQGYGTLLLEHATNSLKNAKVERIWLTVPNQYEKICLQRGFKIINCVEHWGCPGKGEMTPAGNCQLADLIELDRSHWQESHSGLLNLLEFDSYPIANENNMALLQTGLENWRLGPWHCTQKDPHSLRLLLQQALKMTPTDRLLLIDVLCSAEIDMLLRTSGFTCSGKDKLMCQSAEPVSLDHVIALASVGSIG